MGARQRRSPQTLAPVDGIPPVASHPGRPRHRPEALLSDKGYDSHPNRDELRKGTPNIKGTGKLRYVVVQTLNHPAPQLQTPRRRACQTSGPISHSVLTERVAMRGERGGEEG
ncbi:hypothetical protein GCM10009647_076930 [Streptomyces sanglieri]